MWLLQPFQTKSGIAATSAGLCGGVGVLAHVQMQIYALYFLIEELFKSALSDQPVSQPDRGSHYNFQQHLSQNKLHMLKVSRRTRIFAATPELV